MLRSSPDTSFPKYRTIAFRKHTVFLLYSRTRRRFIHTGIVVGVLDEERAHERDVHVCVTVEGNTNDDGSSNGHTTLRKVRTFREAEGHRFVRWAEMVRKAVAA